MNFNANFGHFVQQISQVVFRLNFVQQKGDVLQCSGHQHQSLQPLSVLVKEVAVVEAVAGPECLSQEEMRSAMTTSACCLATTERKDIGATPESTPSPRVSRRENFGNW